MICHMKQTGFHTFIVVSDKVVIGMCGHIRGRHFHIFISGNIHACGIICLVIFSGCDGKSGYSTFSMIHNCIDIRWKYRVRIIIHRYCRICPPQESLRKIRRIINLSFNLDVRFSRIQRDGCHSFGSVHFIGLSYINSTGAIRIL